MTAEERATITGVAATLKALADRVERMDNKLDTAAGAVTRVAADLAERHARSEQAAAVVRQRMEDALAAAHTPQTCPLGSQVAGLLTRVSGVIEPSLRSLEEDRTRILGGIAGIRWLIAGVAVAVPLVIKLAAELGISLVGK